MSRYRKFFASEEITMTDLWEFTLKNIVFITNDKGIKMEKEFQKKLTEESFSIPIATFPVESPLKELFTKFYQVVFPKLIFEEENIENATPRRLIEVFTSLKETDQPMEVYLQLRSYQVVHIFGGLHNPYAYSAPWNIVYLPKVLQPFVMYGEKEIAPRFLTTPQKRFYLAHEKELVDYVLKVKQYIYQQHEEEIRSYNQTMIALLPQIEDFFTSLENKYPEAILKEFKEKICLEFSPISL